MGKQCHVFISHAHDNHGLVREIEARLSRTGLRVLVDNAIAPAKDWVSAVDDGVRVADVFVVLISGTLLASGFAMTELGFVLSEQRSRGGLLLAVLLSGADEASIPTYFQRFQTIDGRGMSAPVIAGMIADAIANAANVEASVLAGSS